MGNMGRTIKTELYKISKRKDSWLFLTILFIPMLYAIGLASNSSVITYSRNGTITALGFSAAMFQTSQSMFIFNVILVAITAKSMATEIENKSLLLYINRIGNRHTIYLGKEIALFVFAVLIELLLFLVSIMSYYFLLSGNTNISSGKLFDANVFSDILQIASVSLFWLITIYFTLALSTKMKTIACVGIYMILYIAMNLISYAGGIKYLSPLFYLNVFSVNDQIMSLYVILFLIYLASVGIVANFIGLRKLSRMDL
ncbi:MAG: hypothetical protein PHS82_13975 [Lachnospiraceae bacterium]|nr:hypothetical protein [Lachnospiraceae bacterium]